MALTDDDLPVLNDVIRTGDRGIIRSTRLRQAGIEQLDSASTGPLQFDLPDHLQLDSPHDKADRQGQHNLPDDTAANIAFNSGDEELESLIDEIIDRHIISLRKDLRALLDRAADHSFDPPRKPLT